MIIAKEYRRNRNGEIARREIVEVECDKCGFHWKTPHYNRIRKTLDTDLCIKCRAKYRAKNRDRHPWEYETKKIKFTCINCGKIQFKNPSYIKLNNVKYCSLKCRDNHLIKEKYGHLERIFDKNPNEVAYLIGLVMGDGNVRKSGEYTVRVGIAFDYTGKWLDMMDTIKVILNRLQIDWFEQPRKHNNCKMIGFALPNYIMEKYEIFYHGDKFSHQPFPSKLIWQNINYAAGLLNSDGWKVRNSFRFCNTVKSIVDSFSQCLSFSKIKHTITHAKGRLDKRTNNVGKDQYTVYIGSKLSVKLKELCKFKLKS